MGPESTNGKIVGVNFFCLIFASYSPSKCNVVFGLSLSRSLSLALSLINNYIHAYMCLTVGRQSHDHRPLSRDLSATFFKILSNCLKRRKNVFWQPADGRVTSDHCRVTVQRLFSKFSKIAWNVQKTLFDSRPTVAWPPTTVAWPFSDFFQKFF